MTGTEDKLRHFLKQVTAELHQTRQRLAAAEETEAIAIVGMACRFPGGVDSPEALWRLVSEGVDAVREFPADRGWDLERLRDPDGSATRHGGFLDGATEFDPGLFGISPHEALGMDPQQRLLLETSWEALEHGGIDPLSLRRAKVGVFAGLMNSSYASGATDIPAESEAHAALGNSTSIASGRISYTFGFEGPSVSVDTACSSSLVTLHLAAQALRTGECSLALAGGATVVSQPDAFISFSQQKALSPDGRCRAFAEEADGFGMAEGAGMLVVERLSDARRLGHRVLALVRGSAVNSDGASNGLTAPNGPSQQRVIREALAAAGLSTSDVDALEAHGTGTSLGDPIEAQALFATYGKERPAARPLLLGSLKSNIGHTQAAAGVGGVIKMVQALRAGVVPRTLHAEHPSSHVDWSAGTVALVPENVPWPAVDRPRRAAVSSFGISGTNAHIILEQALPEPASASPEGAFPLVLSGKTAAALRDQARALRDALAGGFDRADVAHTLATARAALPHRAAVVGADVPAALAALADDEPSDQVVRGVARAQGKVAFVFPGQGSQWPAMARELLTAAPAFAEAAEECAKAFDAHLDWSVLAVLREDAGAPELNRIDVIQPVLFTVMVSLAALWRSYGVQPAAVVGHSQGEVAAAYVAGGLDLDDAALIVAARSKVSARLSGHGAMATVALSQEQLTPRLEPWGERLSVATVNSASSCGVSGEPAALTEFLAACETDGVWAKRVPGLDTAAHSAQVDALRDDLLRDLAGIRPRRSTIPMYSTVTGAVHDTAGFDAGYWYRNLRQPVLYEPAVTALAQDRHTVFVECSPHPVIAMPTRQTLEAAGAEAAVVGSLRREDGGLPRFFAALAEAHVHGAVVDWAIGGRLADLPTYRFQRQRYWLGALKTTGDVTAAGLIGTGHPLLGAAVALPESDAVRYTGRVSLATHPWLADHAAMDAVLLPGTAFVEMAIAAGAEWGYGTLADLTLAAPLVLPAEGSVQLHLALGPAGDTRSVDVYSRAEGTEWTLHATGSLVPTSEPLPDVGAWPPADASPVDLEHIYAELAVIGLGYGPAFQGLRAAWRRGDEVFAEVDLDAPGDGFAVHPALLDASLHGALLGDLLGNGRPGLPFSFTGVRLLPSASTALRVRLSPGANGMRLAATDSSGAPVFSVDAVQTRDLPSADPLYHVDWTPAPVSSSTVDIAVLDEDRLGLGLPVVAMASAPAVLLATVDSSGADLATAARNAARSALDLVQRWLREVPSGSKLVVVTRGVAEASARGLLRSAAAEEPGRFGLLDLDDGPVPALDALATDEPELAVRDGVVLVPRLAKTSPPSGSASLDPEGTVLITGGTGAVGGLLARHLVTAYDVRNLLLVSRRGPDAPGADALSADLADLGATVTIAACDTTDRTRLAEVLRTIPAAHPLTAVVHSAVVLDDGLVSGLTPERLDGVLRPKADAAVALHELTADADLKAFVLFSSAAGVFGNPGQGAYAAANVFLDAFAEHRRSLGLPAHSMAWGLWEERGESTASVSGGGLSTKAGLALFDAALAGERALSVPLRLDLPAVVRGQGGEVPPLLRGLVRVPARRKSSRELASRVAALAPAEAEKLVVDLVRGHVADVLGLADAAEIGPAARFLELGVDSLTGVELRNRINASLGLSLPATLVFEQPTVLDVAQAAVAGFAPAAPAEPAGVFGPMLASAAGRFGEFVELLARAARFRPAFGPGERPDGVDVVRLAKGTAESELICVPSVLAMSGPQEYARFAASLRDLRSTSVLTLPGYHPGEPLPESLPALIDALAEVLSRHVSGPFALAAHSSGGPVAHELARRLAPRGLVLLDTYLQGAEVLSDVQDELTGEMAGASVGDARLTAMGGYLDLFDGWTPSALTTPTLLVRAGTPLPSWANRPNWQATWDAPTVDTPGDHFSMMQDHAPTTATKVHTWLSSL
ncbi:type I polyketide synthase [Amycolatopsis sp. OK19-0408]|uniref:Type I polyketide synthase n=1 Tax=Amycolatopsis iheyensis TaxID=2945988 RepID=A0A9X2SRV7_9PSEU|nr:type I polyketide synthase [Amycolatopsis iheyensis]MCR6490825.1 type I polyketide synthase [Amycolatopsis iheyensis]